MYVPVGGDVEVACDVRVIASTNRDLQAAMEEGRFREDLYYRVNVVQIELPPLRARGTDVLVLAQHFLQEAGARSGKQVSGFRNPRRRSCWHTAGPAMFVSCETPWSTRSP